jgi:hypothetical protein
VPYIRRDLYAKLVAAAGTSASANSPSQQNGDLPKNWDDTGPGHVVIAQQSLDDGWFEGVGQKQ